MAHGNHPCGSLPVTGFSATVWYCHLHMAWFWSVYTYTETGDGEPEMRGTRAGEFGPFDDRDDVVALLQSLVAQGVPQQG